LAAATAFAQRMAAMPTQALVATRHLLRASGTNSYSQQLDLERYTQSAMGKTHDYFEGVNAFLEKRPAQFKGE
jgi:2-(1,2-epoxy-1,2-dihydrophenyl)acetyl-CoA isomerase